MDLQSHRKIGDSFEEDRIDKTKRYSTNKIIAQLHNCTADHAPSYHQNANLLESPDQVKMEDEKELSKV